MGSRPRQTVVVLVFGFALVSMGCAAPSPAQPPVPTMDMARAVVVEVAMFEMGYEPAVLRVPSERPVIFRVHNTGVVEHEFYVGPEQAQQHHAEEMASGEQPHHDNEVIIVAPGERGELVMQFWTHGELLVGCHVPGHYEAGMRAVMTIVAAEEWDEPGPQDDG